MRFEVWNIQTPEHFYLSQNEFRALRVKLGRDREVGVREVVRRHLGEGPTVGNRLSLTNVEGQERGEGRR